ncbi:MAG: hypothetical protein J4F34_02435 [Gemmatimonadetes bacterium]|nr:hypothetical protein [Gemmatimonadota bacterium]
MRWVRTVVAQRIAEISLGCEYCGDRSDLPHDPLVATTGGRARGMPGALRSRAGGGVTTPLGRIVTTPLGRILRGVARICTG